MGMSLGSRDAAGPQHHDAEHVNQQRVEDAHHRRRVKAHDLRRDGVRDTATEQIGIWEHYAKGNTGIFSATSFRKSLQRT